MDCKDLREYGSAYIDNMLTEEEKSNFKNHIKKCADCKIAFKNMKTVVESVNMLERVELPINFSDELHEKLQGAKKYKSIPTLFGKSKILGSVAVILLIFVLSLTLVNNILNHKGGTGFYDKMNDIAGEEKNIDIDAVPGETKEETPDIIDDESIMSLKMVPTDKGEMRRDALDDVQENASGNDEVYKFTERSDRSAKSAAGENVQKLPDDGNLNKIFNSIAVLVLVVCVAVLIYRALKR